MKQEIKSRTTKESILAAAAECFSANGYHSTDIDEICRKANLTKGAFYYHFSSKQDLFIELLELWVDRVAQRLNILEIESRDVLEIISAIPEKFSPVFEDSEQQLQIFLNLLVSSISDKDLKKTMMKPYGKFISYFSLLIQKGVENKSVKTVDPEKTAKILFSLCIGMLMHGLLLPDERDWVELTKESVRMLLK